MTSKEALDTLLGYASFNQNYYFHKGKDPYGIILQDLERLEVLEKKNQELYEKVNHFKNVKNRWKRNCKFLEKENEKLKQAIEILKDRRNILKYNGLKVTYELGWLTEEEYELINEVFGYEN